MSSRTLTIITCIILTILVAVSAIAIDTRGPQLIPESQRQSISPPMVDRAACQLTQSNGNPTYFYDGHNTGDRIAVFHDPTACGASPNYPLEITTVDIALWNAIDAIWPCTLAVTIYDARIETVYPDTCWELGFGLGQQIVVCELDSFAYPAIGTVTFTEPVCVYGPIFLGVEYIGAGAGRWPAILFDDQAVDTCDAYIDVEGTGWIIHHESEFYVVGYPLWWINGETESPSCLDACYWQTGDDYKMHYPQLPDSSGWDVNATWPVVLADDWLCSETGWVKDLHFWGGWRDGQPGVVSQFVLSIHEDIPAGTVCVDTTWATGDCDGSGGIPDIGDLVYLTNYVFSGGPAPEPLWIADMNADCVVDEADLAWFSSPWFPGPPVPACCEMVDYSMPGEKIWSREIFDYEATSLGSGNPAGWYDPSTETVLPDNHTVYYQYDICLDTLQWFPQDSGTVYWLNISAVVEDTPGVSWGWRSSQDHWNDDAVWDSTEITTWQDLYEPASEQSLDLSFVITGEAGGPAVGACCDSSGNCYRMSAAQCSAIGGLYDGDGTSCESDPCDSCDFQEIGDVNGDGTVANAADLLYLVNSLYRFGQPPPNVANADLNGDCCSDWRDVLYLIQYLYFAGPPPVECTCVHPVVCIDAPIPQTPGTVYHNANGYFPSNGAPLHTVWHELYPTYSDDLMLSEWLDNGDGYLSSEDTVFLDAGAGPERELVLGVMPTLTLVGSMFGDTVMMDLIDPPNPMVLPMGDALGSQWHQVYPDYGRTYQLVYWTTCVTQTPFAVGDEILMMGLNGPDSGRTNAYTLAAFETDMITEPLSCCVVRGDIDDIAPETSPDIADLIYMVTFMFQNGPPPPCMLAADINGDGLPEPDIADLIYLVTSMFQDGPPPVDCPD